MDKGTPMPFPLPNVPPEMTEGNTQEQNNRFAREMFDTFFRTPISQAQDILQQTSAQQWEEAGQQRALDVFHQAAERVPAYKDFLKKNDVDPQKIQTVKDFESVPYVDKENYLQQYPLESLMWDGILDSTQMTAVSSGSSGHPFLWPRGSLLEMETTMTFELLLTKYFDVYNKSTLFVNSQSMGMYIGGPFTLNTVLRVAQKGAPINITTPGITLEDVLQVMSVMKDHYEQIILAAYPPFAKDILDVGSERGIDWSTTPIRFMLFGEGFPESWRDYVNEVNGSMAKHHDIINCIGTADAAILGHETEHTIATRRSLMDNRERFEELFGEDRLPSLMQYIPTLRHLELIDGEISFTFGSGGIPLIRYNIHDRGGIIPYRQSKGILEESEGEPVANSWQLPLVYVFGKSDYTATIYGLNVYPENIKAGLLQKSVRQYVSGKFQISTEYDKQTKDQFLRIRIELAPGVKKTDKLKKDVEQSIVETLRNVNAEYRKLFESINERAVPEILLHEWGDDRYFTVGTKQRWKQ